MPYKYRISTEAEWDILESYTWYEKKYQGLGEEFMSELDEAEIEIIPKLS